MTNFFIVSVSYHDLTIFRQKKIKRMFRTQNIIYIHLQVTITENSAELAKENTTNQGEPSEPFEIL